MPLGQRQMSTGGAVDSAARPRRAADSSSAAPRHDDFERMEGNPFRPVKTSMVSRDRPPSPVPSRSQPRSGTYIAVNNHGYGSADSVSRHLPHTTTRGGYGDFNLGNRTPLKIQIRGRDRPSNLAPRDYRPSDSDTDQNSRSDSSGTSSVAYRQTSKFKSVVREPNRRTVEYIDSQSEVSSDSVRPRHPIPRRRRHHRPVDRAQGQQYHGRVPTIGLVLQAMVPLVDRCHHGLDIVIDIAKPTPDPQPPETSIPTEMAFTGDVIRIIIQADIIHQLERGDQAPRHRPAGE